MVTFNQLVRPACLVIASLALTVALVSGPVNQDARDPAIRINTAFSAQHTVAGTDQAPEGARRSVFNTGETPR